MPSTLEALAIFAVAIAPGYGFLSGFQYQRSHTPPERDLYLLAQAFITSAVWIAVTWWPVGHLLSGWTADESLQDHEFMAWLLLCSFLLLPYGPGRLIGTVVGIAGKRKSGPLFQLFRRLGFYRHATLWESTWTEAKDRGGAIVVIRLRDGSTVEGQFSGGSLADSSPRKPRLYLEKAYGWNKDGQRVIFPRGAYLEGDQIAAVQFKT